MSRYLDEYQDREVEAEARRHKSHSDSVPGAVAIRNDRERAAEWDRESTLLIRREQRRFAAQQST